MLAALEEHAEENADQYHGCVQCNESHHSTAFCPVCGVCFHQGRIVNKLFCTLVECVCGLFHIWD